MNFCFPGTFLPMDSFKPRTQNSFYILHKHLNQIIFFKVFMPLESKMGMQTMRKGPSLKNRTMGHALKDSSSHLRERRQMKGGDLHPALSKLEQLIKHGSGNPKLQKPM